MYHTSLTTSPFESCELGRTYTPFATWLPGYNMEMVVRYFLSAIYAVVLKSEDTKRLIRTN